MESAPPATTLLLIRHARPHHQHDLQGADPDLTAEGRAQAEVLAEAVAGGRYGPVDILVSSTMRRARQTATPLGEALGLDVTLDQRLVEIDAGWPRYGIDFDKYPSRAAAFASLNGGSFGGYDFDPEAFGKRVVEGVESALEQNPGRNVAIVCHGGVISAYLAQVLDLSRLLFLVPGYTSVSRVMIQPDGYREFVSANETGHVRPTPEGEATS